MEEEDQKPEPPPEVVVTTERTKGKPTRITVTAGDSMAQVQRIDGKWYRVDAEGNIVNAETGVQEEAAEESEALADLRAQRAELQSQLEDIESDPKAIEAPFEGRPHQEGLHIESLVNDIAAVDKLIEAEMRAAPLGETRDEAVSRLGDILSPGRQQQATTPAPAPTPRSAGHRRIDSLISALEQQDRADARVRLEAARRIKARIQGVPDITEAQVDQLLKNEAQIVLVDQLLEKGVSEEQAKKHRATRDRLVLSNKQILGTAGKPGKEGVIGTELTRDRFSKNEVNMIRRMFRGAEVKVVPGSEGSEVEVEVAGKKVRIARVREPLTKRTFGAFTPEDRPDLMGAGVYLGQEDLVGAKLNVGGKEIDAESIILLTGVSDLTTIPHEVFHLAMDLVLTKSEQDYLFRKYAPGESRDPQTGRYSRDAEETVAEAYQAYGLSQAKNPIFRKFADFWRNLADRLFLNFDSREARRIFRDLPRLIETAREPGEGGAEGVKLQTISEDQRKAYVTRQIDLVKSILDGRWKDRASLKNRKIPVIKAVRSEAQKDSDTVVVFEAASWLENEIRSNMEKTGFAPLPIPGAKVRDLSADEKELLAEAMAAEGAVAFESDITKEDRDKAIGWYGRIIEEALDELSFIFPELAYTYNTDPAAKKAGIVITDEILPNGKTTGEARLVFKLMLAITSDGEKVGANFRNAINSYAIWRDSGGIKGKFKRGDLPEKMKEALDLIDTYGWEATDKFLAAKFKVKYMNQELGFDIKSELVDTEVPAASMIGPKLGSFFNNLNQRFDTLTMDLWWSRTIGRLRGTLLSRNVKLARENSTETKKQKNKTLPSFVSVIDPANVARYLGKGVQTEKASVIKGMSDEEFVGSNIVRYAVALNAKNGSVFTSTATSNIYNKELKGRGIEGREVTGTKKDLDKEGKKYYNSLLRWAKARAKEKDSKWLEEYTGNTEEKTDALMENVLKAALWRQQERAAVTTDEFKAAGRIYSSMFGVYATPKNGNDRVQQREITAKAIDKFSEEHAEDIKAIYGTKKGAPTKITMADFQAMMWYHEKQLWTNLGVKGTGITTSEGEDSSEETEKDLDYGTAARAVTTEYKEGVLELQGKKDKSGAFTKPRKRIASDAKPKRPAKGVRRKLRAGVAEEGDGAVDRGRITDENIRAKLEQLEKVENEALEKEIKTRAGMGPTPLSKRVGGVGTSKLNDVVRVAGSAVHDDESDVLRPPTAEEMRASVREFQENRAKGAEENPETAVGLPAAKARATLEKQEPRNVRTAKFQAAERRTREAGLTRFERDRAAISTEGAVEDEGRVAENTPREDEVVGGRVDPTVRGRQFRDGIAATARDHPLGAAVEVKDLDFYQDPDNHLYLTKDLLSGVAVTDGGDLVSVFKHPDSKANINLLLNEAGKSSNTLDGYDIDGFLPTLYGNHGFRPAAILTWNDEYAPPNWPYDLAGKPNIVLMVRDVDGLTGLPEVPARKDGGFASIREQIPVFDDYGDADTHRSVEGEAAFRDAEGKWNPEAARFQEAQRPPAFKHKQGTLTFDNPEDEGFASDVPAYSVRRGATPKKTVTRYKAFRIVEGHLRPLYVGAKDNIPMGVWLDAKQGGGAYETLGERQYVLGETGQSRSLSTFTPESIKRLRKAGIKGRTAKFLAFRPGWHTGTLPFNPQGAGEVVTPSKTSPWKYKLYKNVVFAEVEVAADKNYQEEYERTAKRTGKGDINPRESGLRDVPVDGYYDYDTNTTTAEAPGTWSIAGSLKVKRLLTHEEANKILRSKKVRPQLRVDGGKFVKENRDAVAEKSDARQYKLTDPVTKDDEGKRIPAKKRGSGKHDPRFQPVPAAVNRRYMELARDPEANRDELQKMVDDAAEAAGYNVGPVYHGTKQKFHTFEHRRDPSDLFYFSFSEDFAKDYARGTGGHRVPPPEIARRISKVKEESSIHTDRLFEQDAKKHGKFDVKKPGAMGRYENIFKKRDAFERRRLDGMTVGEAEMEMGINIVNAHIKAPKLFDPRKHWREYLPLLEDVVGEQENNWSSQVRDAVENGGYLIWEARAVVDAVLEDYDGMIIQETLGKPPNTVAVRNPSQIKSAEPVTRDDAGNVIPLSERFDPSTEDTRFQQITPAEWRKVMERRAKRRDRGERRAEDADLAEALFTPESVESLRAVDEIRASAGYQGRKVSESDQAVRERAEQFLEDATTDETKQAKVDELIKKVERGEDLEPWETWAARKLLEAKSWNALIEHQKFGRDTDSEKAVEEALRMWSGYRDTGEQWSQAGRMRQDQEKNPSIANRKAALDALLAFTVPEKNKLRKLKKILRANPDGSVAHEHAKKRIDEVLESAKKRVLGLKKKLKAAGVDLASAKNNWKDPRFVSNVINQISIADSTYFDKQFEFFRSGLMSGTGTVLRNVVGNTLNATWELTAQRFTSAFLNTVTPGSRAGGATFGEFKHIIKGLIQSMPEAIENFRESWAMERVVFSDEVGSATDRFGSARLELTGKGRRGPKIAGRRGRAWRWSQRMALSMDQFFQTAIATQHAQVMAHRIALREKKQGQAMTNRMIELTSDKQSEAWVAAYDEALRLTYQEKLDPVGEFLLKGRGLIPGIRYKLPFFTTPWNIARVAGKKTPIGSLRLAWKLGRLGRAKMGWDSTYDYHTMNNLGSVSTRQAVVEDVAEQLIAWTIFMSMVAYAEGPDEEDGLPNITGSAEKHSSKRGEQYRVAAPYTIRVPFTNERISYQGFSPLDISLATMVDAVDAIKEAKNDKATMAALADGLKSAVNLFSDQSSMRGFKDIITLLTEPTESGVMRFLTDTGVAFVPNIVRQASRESDPFYREYRTGGEIGTGEWWTSGMTMLGKKALPLAQLAPSPKVELWGRDVKRGDWVGNPVGDWLLKMSIASMTRIYNYDPSDAHKLNTMIRIWNVTNPNDGLYPTQPKKNFKRDGESYVMSDPEYHRFLKLAGEYALERASGWGFDYENPTERDIERIKKFIRRGRSRAKDTIIRERRDREDKAVDRAG